MNKKLVLLGLVVVGFALTVPSARAGIGRALAPVGRMLAGPIARLKEPFESWTAQNDAKHLVAGLSYRERRGRRLPTGRNFERYVLERLNPKREGLDPWGNAWSLEVQSDSIVVWSPGRDSIPETEDDIRITQARQ